MKSNPTIRVSEIFGPTVQGEGPDFGRPCIFLRLHSCPVHCPGCDTAYTWNGAEHGAAMSVDKAFELVTALRQGRSKLGLVVTGGEPLVYYNLPSLQEAINRGRFQWTGLETSGYAGKKELDPGALNAFLLEFTTVTVSPKITPCLHGLQEDHELLKNIPLLLRCRPRMCHKFVIRDDFDIQSVLSYQQTFGIPSEDICLMPYGNERDEILQIIEKEILSACYQYGFTVTPRLQALLWGMKRGV